MTAFAGLVRDVTRHRELTLGLVRRELFSPFAGSAFGVCWALLHPLLQMAVYLVVFTYIFNMRMGGSGMEYQAYILSGLVPWLAWASLLSAACTTVVGSATLVRQADFPAEVLPLRTVLAALVPHAVSLFVLLLYIVVRHQVVPWTWALLPAVVALQAAAMLGFAYLLGALAVFVRDIKEVVLVLTSMGLFLTPVLYTPEVLAGIPSAFSWLVQLNPFTHFVLVYRDCLFHGAIEHPWSWGVVAALAVGLCGLGHRLFTRLKIFFGNFL